MEKNNIEKEKKVKIKLPDSPSGSSGNDGNGNASAFPFNVQNIGDQRNPILPLPDSNLSQKPPTSSATLWATKSKSVSKKKLLLIHCGDNIKRIAFTEKTSADAIEKTIRRECGIAETENFSLLDHDLDSVVIDGSMVEEEVWLDIGSTGQLSRAKVSQQIALTVIPSRGPPDFSELPVQKAVKHTFNVSTGKWSKANCEVKIDKQPFGKGSLRHAYYMQDLSDPKNLYVAKASIDPFEDREVYFQDVEMQLQAKRIAEIFNTYNPPKKIEFIQTWVITLPNNNDEMYKDLNSFFSKDLIKIKNSYAVEKFIDGPYRKHNNNYGFVNETERNTPQAFSHFSFEVTKHQALICDIQGVNDQYTDPQIHTIECLPGVGKGNLGSLGISKFLATHRCNAICRYLKLPLINEKDKTQDMGTTPQQPFMNSKNVRFVNVQFFPNEQNGLLKSNYEQTPLLNSQSKRPNPSNPSINMSKSSRCCTLI